MIFHWLGCAEACLYLYKSPPWVGVLSRWRKCSLFKKKGQSEVYNLDASFQLNTRNVYNSNFNPGGAAMWELFSLSSVILAPFSRVVSVTPVSWPNDGLGPRVDICLQATCYNGKAVLLIRTLLPTNNRILLNIFSSHLNIVRQTTVVLLVATQITCTGLLALGVAIFFRFVVFG